MQNGFYFDSVVTSDFTCLNIMDLIADLIRSRGFLLNCQSLIKGIEKQNMRKQLELLSISFEPFVPVTLHLFKR